MNDVTQNLGYFNTHPPPQSHSSGKSLMKQYKCHGRNPKTVPKLKRGCYGMVSLDQKQLSWSIHSWFNMKYWRNWWHKCVKLLTRIHVDYTYNTTRENPVPDLLAVLYLDNRLYIYKSRNGMDQARAKPLAQAQGIYAKVSLCHDCFRFAIIFPVWD